MTRLAKLSAAQKERIVRAALKIANRRYTEYPLRYRCKCRRCAEFFRACAAAERAAKPIKEKRRA